MMLMENLAAFSLKRKHYLNDMRQFSVVLGYFMSIPVCTIGKVELDSTFFKHNYHLFCCFCFAAKPLRFNYKNRPTNSILFQNRTKKITLIPVISFTFLKIMLTTNPLENR